MDNPIIVALDGLTSEEAKEKSKQLQGAVWGFKFNDLLYTRSGIDAIFNISAHGNIMIDPKLHDITNTVKNSCNHLRDALVNVNILTVHASGGPDMIKVAAHIFPNEIAAVTVLTSISSHLCLSLFNKGINELVADLANEAQASGASYIVCSPLELESLANITVPKIVPGIRPLWYQQKDDQARKATPVEAIEKGAKFLVMGRPILNDSDPVAAVQRTLDEIRKG